MKRIIILIVILLSVHFKSNSQAWGVKAGVNLSSIVAINNNLSYSDVYKLNTGFHLGPSFELPVWNFISLETGIFLSTKGYKFIERGSFLFIPIEMSLKLNMFYLDMPVTAKVSTDLGWSEVYACFGPYVGVGLCGNYRGNITVDCETECLDENFDFDSSDEIDNIKRLDYGLVFGAGFEIRKIVLEASYNLGLANVSASHEDFDMIRNRVVKLSLGYKF